MRHLLAALLLALPALAGSKAPAVDPQPISVRAELVQLTDERASRLGGRVRVPDDFFEAAARGRVLQSILVALTGTRP